MVEAKDCVLELLVQDAPVGDDKDGLEDLLVVCVVQ